MGFDPRRQHRRSTFDYYFVAASVVGRRPPRLGPVCLMSRPKSSRDPGKSKGPNAKEKRHRAKPANAKRKGSAAKKRRRSSGSKRAARRPDPSDVPGAEVRFIQPYDAVKGYVCPAAIAPSHRVSATWWWSRPMTLTSVDTGTAAAGSTGRPSEPAG
ncbi:MAG: hypothetical protein R2710_04825 [Acidimicrobiales bacterium]